MAHDRFRHGVSVQYRYWCGEGQIHRFEARRLGRLGTAFIYANLDYENGLRVYDVEFFSGNKEYDYKINAATGDIVSFDQDIEWYAAGGYQAQANTDIGAEKAKSIALEHAGVAAADTVFINVELDYDDGMRVYDVEFFSGNKEYDYKIDAASGAILGFDFDVEWYTVSSKASDYIGEAKAKQIVEQAARYHGSLHRVQAGGG